MDKLKNTILTLMICFLTISSMEAQRSQTLDRIIAVIGEEVVLESDVDNQFNHAKINGAKDDGTLRCQVMETLIIDKLLLDKARQDSIEVSDIEVELELDRRMQIFLSQIERSEFEKIYGKPIEQFREDIRGDIKKELLTQRQRGVLEEATDITPKEVRKFFNGLDKDSLGLLPAEVQLNHIVIKPPYSEESREKAVALLTDLKQQVEEGANFGELASKNTDEPGGRGRKGSLGWFGRGQMVPQFEEVVFQMRINEVSEPLETEFGYHIIQLHERKGERVRASHILKRLKHSANGDSVAMDSLVKIMDLVKADSFTFEQAAILYSQDRGTKHCGGCISNPQTQELRIPMDLLDPDMYFKIDDMNPGEFSDPSEMQSPDGSRAFHVIYLKHKIPPHKPNLKDDYQKIRNAALLAKRAENFDSWLQSAKKNIYIDIKPTECQNALTNWSK